MLTHRWWRHEDKHIKQVGVFFRYRIACQKKSVLMRSFLSITVNSCSDTGNLLWILPLPLTPCDHKTPVGILT